MARTLSIGRQVDLILKQHTAIGVSKRISREISGIRSVENGHKVSDYFHSIKSLKNARNDLTNLGKYAKEVHGIKEMSKIDHKVIKQWIKDKNISYNTASNYLSEINKVHKHLNISREEVKELRKELKNVLSKKELDSRAYKHLEKIQLPEKSQPAFELQRDYGLRVSATTNINIDKQIKGNIFSYAEKGGKISSKELSPTLIDKIKNQAVNGHYEVNNRTYYRALKKEIEKTGQKYNGTHGIRHTYAQNQLENGKSKKEVSEEMGHSREEITNIYIR